MDENSLAYKIEISNSDWEKTPASVKQLVEKIQNLPTMLRQRWAMAAAGYAYVFHS